MAILRRVSPHAEFAQKSCRSPLPSRARPVGVLVAVVLLQLSVTGVAALRTVDSVKCGCGTDMTLELQVTPTVNKDCTQADFRRPLELRGKKRSYSPLNAKVRRSPKGSYLVISWRLNFIPSKKRSRLFDFNLFITKTAKRGRPGRQNGGCFTVRELDKMCRRKLTCKASLPSTSPRRLAVQVMYRYKARPRTRSKHLRPSKAGQIFYRLKTSLKRKTKQRGSRGGARNKNKIRRRQDKTSIPPQMMAVELPEVQSCETWIPKVTLTADAANVTVTFSPANPFASELELALHDVGSSRQIHLRRIPVNVKTYTFTNVRQGTYRVSLRPHGSHCSRAMYIFSRTSVNVTGKPTADQKEESSRSKRHKHIKGCEDWRPRITLRAEGGTVVADYSPVNPLASGIEIGLREPGSLSLLFKTHIPKNLTTYMFKNVEAGDYRLSVLPLGPECRSATYIASRQIVKVQERPPTTPAPICSHWEPAFRARMISHGSWCLVEVDIDMPPNIAAETIQVALEEVKVGPDQSQKKEIVIQDFIGVDQNRTMFNVTLRNDDKTTYKALVRPCGCKDCQDYIKYKEECYLSFAVADIIGVKYHANSAPVAVLSSHPYQPGSTRVARIQSNGSHHPNTGHSNRHVHQRVSTHSDKQDRRTLWGGLSHADPSDQPYALGRRQCDDCCRRCGCHAASR